MLGTSASVFPEKGIRRLPKRPEWTFAYSCYSISLSILQAKVHSTHSLTAAPANVPAPSSLYPSRRTKAVTLPAP
jgi:hypothetical protein